MNGTYGLPKGFCSAGIHAGLKKKNKDLGLIVSAVPCRVAAMFTSNRLKCAHILYDSPKTGGDVEALMVNSGNANALTGPEGVRDLERIAAALGETLHMKGQRVLFASTGIIGKRLQVPVIMKALPELLRGLSPKDTFFPDAIMTTDTVRKTRTACFAAGGKKVTLTAAAKGAGMIAPNMATLLVFIMTDAVISRVSMRKALGKAVCGSFNRITVDNDMSPNDSVFLLANGAAGNREIKAGADYRKFEETLAKMCLELAKECVMDAEGATKFLDIRVSGAKTEKDAKKAALGVANSLLVKTAFFGRLMNFGRIASAVGSSGANVDPGKMSVAINGRTVIRGGRRHMPAAVKNELTKRVIRIDIKLGAGKACYNIYTNDISYEYVRVNAAYT